MQPLITTATPAMHHTIIALRTDLRRPHWIRQPTPHLRLSLRLCSCLLCLSHGHPLSFESFSALMSLIACCSSRRRSCSIFSLSLDLNSPRFLFLDIMLKGSTCFSNVMVNSTILVRMLWSYCCRRDRTWLVGSLFRMKSRFYVKHFVIDLGICLKECELMGLSLHSSFVFH